MANIYEKKSGAISKSSLLVILFLNRLLTFNNYYIVCLGHFKGMFEGNSVMTSDVVITFSFSSIH